MNIILAVGFIALYGLLVWVAWWKVPRALAADAAPKGNGTAVVYALLILFLFGSIPGLCAFVYRLRALRHPRVANTAFIAEHTA